jgi:hypothetical protein
VKKWLLLVVTAVVLIGCTSSNSEQGERIQPVQLEEGDATNIPDWLFDSFRQKFSQPDEIKKESITLVYLRMDRKNRAPEIAAFLTTSHMEGWFVLYAEENGAYREVYAKGEPVYGLQVHGAVDHMISFVSGLGGSGVQKNNYHLIKYTKQGYKEVWNGVAYDVLANGPPPLHKKFGTFFIDEHTGTLYYKQTAYNYNEDFEHVSSTKETSQVYHYDEEKDVFIPSS